MGLGYASMVEKRDETPFANRVSLWISWSGSYHSVSRRSTPVSLSSYPRWAARPKATQLKKPKPTPLKRAEGRLTSQHKRMKDEAIRAIQG